MEDSRSIRTQLRHETERPGPPEGFPQFPDLPGRRYTELPCKEENGCMTL